MQPLNSFASAAVLAVVSLPSLATAPGDTAPGAAPAPPLAIGIDATGNTYLLSQTWGGARSELGTDWDITLECRGRDGATRWTYRYDGPGGWCDTPTALAVDDRGNAYISALVYAEPDPDGAFATHAALLKINPDGALAWQFLDDLPSHHGAGFFDVDFAPDGSIVTAGLVETATRHREVLAACLTADGRLLWQAQTSAPDFLQAEDRQLRERVYAGIDGRVLVAASQSPGVTLLSQYAPDGRCRWPRTLERPGLRVVGDPVADDEGNLFLPALCEWSGAPKACLISLDGDGNDRWLRAFDIDENDAEPTLWTRVGLDGLIYLGVGPDPGQAPADPDCRVWALDSDGHPASPGGVPAAGSVPLAAGTALLDFTQPRASGTSAADLLFFFGL